MTHPALIERITRSLAYMLRHQPEKFDLELDSHGFGELEDVARALADRIGEPIEIADVEAAVSSGDRPRYEIRGTKIRALYGHSIEVEPGDPAQPPEFLYVGIDARDLQRAQQFGLRGGRRRFLHLALSAEDAREAGRRAAREYAILRVYALDAWEESINFYDRKTLYLAEHIPTAYLEVLERASDGYEPRFADEGGGDRFERGERHPRRGDRSGDSERHARPSHTHSERRETPRPAPARDMHARTERYSDAPQRSERRRESLPVSERAPLAASDSQPRRERRDERPPRHERPREEFRPAPAHREHTAPPPEPRRVEERRSQDRAQVAPPRAAAADDSFGHGVFEPEPARAPQRATPPAPSAAQPPPSRREPAASDSASDFGAGL